MRATRCCPAVAPAVFVLVRAWLLVRWSRGRVMGRPPTGYSWPPFEAGNEVSVRHGAHSSRRVDPIASDLLAAVDGDSGVTWLRPVDRPALMAWARTEARIQLVSDWLADRGGDIDDAGQVRPAVALLNRLEARAESLRGRLGFDPLSRARLGRDVAAATVDLASLWAAEGAETAAGPVTPDTGPAPSQGTWGATDDG
jgi:hypothetical protein